MDEAGLFTLRFVITGLSTKKAAEICNTSEQTYKKWESTRIYPIDALDLIKANANTKTKDPVKDVTTEFENKIKQALGQAEPDTSTVIKFPR